MRGDEEVGHARLADVYIRELGLGGLGDAVLSELKRVVARVDDVAARFSSTLVQLIQMSGSKVRQNGGVLLDHLPMRMTLPSVNISSLRPHALVAQGLKHQM